MKLSSKKTAICLIACTAILFSSCSKKSANAIVGKWHDDKDNTVTEFKADGTLVVTGPDKSVLNGTYKFSDDTHFSAAISMPMPPEAKAQAPAGTPDKLDLTLDCTVKITGDDMDLDTKASAMGQPSSQTDHSHLKRVP